MTHAPVEVATNLKNAVGNKMKKESNEKFNIWKITYDPDWGTRFPRVNKSYAFVSLPLGKKINKSNYKKIIKECLANEDSKGDFEFMPLQHKDRFEFNKVHIYECGE